MKWLIVALINPTPDAFGLVDLYVYKHPFPTEIECYAMLQRFDINFQIDLNEKHGTTGIEYPIRCLPEKEVYNSIPDST
jgi:hypothetical protein